MFTLILATAISLLLYIYCKKPSGLPPGRWGLPILGYIPLYTKDPTKIASNLRKDFGDIFTWRLGSITMVGLCDPKIIKTTFSRPECQGRPFGIGRNIYNYEANVGLLISTGKAWSDGRKFALRHLKDFGMGKTSMEGIIQKEALVLAEGYAKNSGKPVEVSWALNVAVLNVIWKLVADKRYDVDDKEIIRFNCLYANDLNIIQGPVNILDVFPVLYKILPELVLNKWMKMNELYTHINQFKDFFMDIIKEHEKTLDPNNPRDYIDGYLIEVQKERNSQETIFKDDYLNLVASITSLFRAGSETTSSTTRWLIALMALNPEVQQRVQREIDEVIPRGCVPSLQDKEKMPYTEAMLLEVLRYSSLVPMGLFHENTEPITIGNYLIPKGTTLFAHAKSCHTDSKYWERPHDFYPDHFLDADGKLLTKKEGFLPFSLGRRQCLGESLARMELFLFATCLLQRLSISIPEGETIKAEVGDVTNFIVRSIKPYKVVLTDRL